MPPTITSPGARKYSQFYYQDGKASVEHHIGILLEDLAKYGSQITLSAAEDLMVKEAFLGLHYVWRMRVHENLSRLDPELMERLRQALLLFQGRRVKAQSGPKFMSKPVPSRHSVFALIVFLGFVRDVTDFREAVNAKMTAADIRRALDLGTWLAVKAIEEDEEAPEVDDLTGVVWSNPVISLDEVRRLAVSTTLYLAETLNSISSWRDIVEPKAHAAFELCAAEAHLDMNHKSGKVLLAPKGQYWDVKAEKVLAMFRTTVEAGLTAEEVTARREVYGDNRPEEAKKASYFRILIRQLADLIVMILIFAAAVSAGMGDYDAAVVIGIVVVVNTLIGFTQEVKAERAISALASLSVPQCTVVRDGEQSIVDAGDLVPGDIVILDEGAMVPADLRLVSVSQLAIIETILTGESVPLDKNTDPVVGHRRVNIGDRLNTAFQATTVTRGRGVGVVVNTGETTEIGRISKAINSTHVGKTPLQKKLEVLGKVLVVVALVMCAAIVAIGLAWDPNDSEIIKVGVSLALSVIPEGLVAIVTLTMALGMTRMAKKNALVRQLPAVETLGSVTTICSDKTGTITEGVMKARLLWSPNDLLSAPAPLPDSSDKRGLIPFIEQVTVAQALMAHHDLPVATSDEFPRPSLWQLAVMEACNNSTTKRSPEGHLIGIGDQTEVALKVLAEEMCLPWQSACCERTHEIAFDSDRKRMTIVADVKDDMAKMLGLPEKGSRIALSKGAPEVLMLDCTKYMTQEGGTLPLTPEKLREIEQWCDDFAEQGLRTLALAVRFSDVALSKLKEFGEEFVEKDLTFVGLVALADPPKKNIEKAIAVCHRAGIRVVMITGDHMRTAMSIARSIGILPPAALADSGLVMSGQALSSMTVEQVVALHPFPVVFSRVSPDNKLAIVKALQLRGEIVAMTGDGVNDAPAIRQADVGIAMGISGTDITRQAADIILSDDNFSAIVAAVEEGRKIFDNITKFIVYLLSCNLSEVVLMFVTVSAGQEAPLNALMILYANIVVDIPPSLALGAEDIEPNAMTRKPRDPRKPILGKTYFIALIVQASSIGLLAFAVYMISLYVYDTPLDEAQSETFATLFIVQTIHAFLSRSIRNSIRTTGLRELLFGNMWLFGGCSFSVLAVIAGIYIPGFNHIFGLTTIKGHAWVEIVVACVIHVAVVETGKVYIRRAKEANVVAVGRTSVDGRSNALHSQAAMMANNRGASMGGIGSSMV